MCSKSCPDKTVPEKNSPKLQKNPRQSSPRQNCPMKADKIDPNKNRNNCKYTIQTIKQHTV